MRNLVDKGAYFWYSNAFRLDIAGLEQDMIL